MKSAHKLQIILSFAFLVFVSACSTKNPEPIKLNIDNCDHCKMTVTDLKFATELITDKGRIYKFDDLKCMVKYNEENSLKNALYFVPDHNSPENLIRAEKAIYVKGENVRTPMNGFIATFAAQDEASSFATQNGADIITWKEVIE